MLLPELKVLLASPRGLRRSDAGCSDCVHGVKKFGTPVYVRHEIVHNKYVVQKLADEGAVFVNELDEVPDKAVVIFRRTESRSLWLMKPAAAV